MVPREIIPGAMPAHPDPRWQLITAGRDESGQFLPMSFEALETLATEWAALVPDESSPEGALALLRTARSLFVHAWFDYEFMVVACLVGFQALEAAFRRLYPEAKKGTPWGVLVKRAREEKVLPPNIADVAETGVKLRNLMSHPASARVFTVGMAAPMLENTHRQVALLLSAPVAREKRLGGPH